MVGFLFGGKGFAAFINWTSLTVNGVICFVVPFLLFIKVGTHDCVANAS